MKIYDDELVCGMHITTLATKLGMRTLDIQHLTALHNSRYTELIGSKNATKPLGNGTLSLLIRFLTNHPEYSPIQPPPKVDQLLELIRSVPGYEEFSKRQIGPLLGCEIGSSYRWFNPQKLGESDGKPKGSSGTSPIVDRLISLLYNNLAGKDIKDRKAFMDLYESVLKDECKARGIDEEEFAKNGFKRKRFMKKIQELGIDESFYSTRKSASTGTRVKAKSKAAGPGRPRKSRAKAKTA